MSSLAIVPKDNSSEKKFIRKPVIVFTERDAQIINFLLEMRFAGLYEIHERFFKKKKDNQVSESLWWARERLSQLEKAGYVSRTHSFFEQASFYLGTVDGYWALRDFEYTHPPLKPRVSIDLKTFKHDRLVLSERLALEGNKNVTDWVSDRRLKMSFARQFQIPTTYVPDGIYTTPEGQKVAFELEISRKAIGEYRNKIKTYVQLMRDFKSHSEMFQKVHYLCFSKTVARLLRAETKIYGELFEVEERPLPEKKQYRSKSK